MQEPPKSLYDYIAKLYCTITQNYITQNYIAPSYHILIVVNIINEDARLAGLGGRRPTPLRGSDDRIHLRQHPIRTYIHNHTKERIRVRERDRETNTVVKYTTFCPLVLECVKISSASPMLLNTTPRDHMQSAL
jgi:uncharacterized protein YlaI